MVLDIPKFKMVGDYNEVFYRTHFYSILGKKINECCYIWNLDTGAGWFGKMTNMDVKLRILASDIALDLYPEFKGRK
jgi:hypothetical protein